MTSALSATFVPLTQTSAFDSTPLKSRKVRWVVSSRFRSLRYHHGTVKSDLGTFFMFVEKNGSGYFPFCSSPA